MAVRPYLRQQAHFIADEEEVTTCGVSSTVAVFATTGNTNGSLVMALLEWQVGCPLVVAVSVRRRRVVVFLTMTMTMTMTAIATTTRDDYSFGREDPFQVDR